MIRNSRSEKASGAVVQRRIGHHSQSGKALPSLTVPGSLRKSDSDSKLIKPGVPGPLSKSHSNSRLASVLGPLSKSDSSSRLKPSVKATIESMASNGSSAEYFKPEQTIILFDWDDTLCPSSWIQANRPNLSFFKPAPQHEKIQRPLRELQKHVEAVLQLSLKLGKVVIVTNAMEPWVETSCRNFMPRIMPYLSEIPVIYARSVFDQYNCEQARRRSPASPINYGTLGAVALPGLYSASGKNKLENYNAGLAMRTPVTEISPQQWKELVFQQEISGFYSRYEKQSWKNVVSIGDAIFERDACRRVVVNRPSTKKKCRTKTAKLLDDPDIEELIAQVEIIHDALGLIVQHDGNLDIEIDEEDLKVGAQSLSLAEKIMDR